MKALYTLILFCMLAAYAGQSWSYAAKTDSDYRSVNEQSGIYAGEGGFDIQVGKHTALDGAVIDSRAGADKNRLSTATLSYDDLQNNAAYNSESSSVGISTNGPSGFGTGSEKGSDSSTSRSAVAAGTLDIRDGENQQQDLSGLSRDPGQSHRALSQIFDKEAVAERQELAQLFGEEAFRAVGDVAERQRKAAARELLAAERDYDTAQAEGDSAGAQAAEQRMQDATASLDRWAEGGIARVALHTVVGGLQAEMGNGNALAGAAGAATSASMTGKVNDYINEALAGSIMPDTLKRVVANLATNAIDGAAGSAIDSLSGGGSSGAQAALGVDRYNRQLHPEEIHFLQDKDRIARYVAYVKETTGETLTVEEAALSLQQYGAAMADEHWAALNGRDVVAEDFIRGEVAQSGGFYATSNGSQHTVFDVSAEEYKDETINLRQLFDAYGKDPAVGTFLSANFDETRVENWSERYRAGQVQGYQDAGNEANLLGDTGTLASGLVNIPSYIYQAATSDEVGPLDSQRMSEYYQTLLKVQGRAEEAGYLSEYDWATTQRLTTLGIPLAEVGGAALIKTVGAAARVRTPGEADGPSGKLLNSDLARKDFEAANQRTIDDQGPWVGGQTLTAQNQKVIDAVGDVASSEKQILNLSSVPAEQVNVSFIEQGLKSPYLSTVRPREFTAASELAFVRVHGPTNQEGVWMVRASEIEGMSAAEIQSHLGLKYPPTQVSPVTVLEGAEMRVGRVGPQSQWGAPNPQGVQYELLDLSKARFGQPRPLQ